MRPLKKMFVSVAVGTMALLSSAGIVSATNLPGVSEDVHITCYPLITSGRAYAINNGSRYIDAGDECYITAIDGDNVYVHTQRQMDATVSGLTGTILQLLISLTPIFRQSQRAEQLRPTRMLTEMRSWVAWQQVTCAT